MAFGATATRACSSLALGKATGKSSFLQALQEAIEDVYEGRCRTVYINMSDGDAISSPLKMVDELINDSIDSANTHDAIDRLNGALRER